MYVENKNPLPDGEWFAFWRIGNDNDHLRHKQISNDEAVIEPIRQRRIAMCKSRIPNWAPHEPRYYGTSMFEDMRVDFGADLLPTSSRFEGPAPKKRPHFDFMNDEASELPDPCGPWTVIPIVSSIWKQVLKSFDEDIADFIPHTLIFENEQWDDNFVAHNKRFAHVVVPEDCDDTVEKYIVGGIDKYRVYSDPGVVVRRSALVGKHWIVEPGPIPNDPFVSRELALALNPLLNPDFQKFEPLLVLDYP